MKNLYVVFYVQSRVPMFLLLLFCVMALHAGKLECAMYSSIVVQIYRYYNVDVVALVGVLYLFLPEELLLQLQSFIGFVFSFS